MGLFSISSSGCSKFRKCSNEAISKLSELAKNEIKERDIKALEKVLTVDSFLVFHEQQM